MSENKLGNIYQRLKKDFKQAGLNNAGLEAFLLLEWVAGINYKDIIVEPDRILDEKMLSQLEDGLTRRYQGESIHRIRGWREFYGLPFQLSSDTLEPRPDSETLVDLVLPFIQERAKQSQTIQLLDVGTGSGALAIALLTKVENLHALGVDIAPGALEMAVKNAQLNQVSARFAAQLSNGFDKVEGVYDFIISNPPYIAQADINGLDKMVRDFDPIIALDGGEDGLDFYRHLALRSGNFLQKKGFVGVEIGQGQKARVRALFEFHGLAFVTQKNDLSGHCRALLFTNIL